MKLAQAEKLVENHPPAEERREMLKEQVQRFRREFYGHLTDLRRIDSWEKRNGKLPSLADAAAMAQKDGLSEADAASAQTLVGLVQARQQAEAALDQIADAIQANQTELKKLDPDA